MVVSPLFKFITPSTILSIFSGQVHPRTTIAIWPVCSTNPLRACDPQHIMWLLQTQLLHWSKLILESSLLWESRCSCSCCPWNHNFPVPSESCLLESCRSGFYLESRPWNPIFPVSPEIPLPAPICPWKSRSSWNPVAHVSPWNLSPWNPVSPWFLSYW